MALLPGIAHRAAPAAPSSALRHSRSLSAVRLPVLAAEADDLALLLRLGAELEVLAALDGEHLLRLALGALHLQHDLLRGLRLLVEHGLGLAAETGLLRVVTTLTLRGERVLALLVLRDLVVRVLLALLAEGVARLRDVDHRGRGACATPGDRRGE